MTRYVENFNLAALEADPDREIVDIGCGDGTFARNLVEAGYRVKGVEPAKYLRDQFEAWANQAPAGQAKVVDGTAEKLPFADDSINTAVITEVLEHVDDPAVCLREIHRAMKPGGVVCASVPTSQTERIFWKIHPEYKKNSTHLRIFKKQQLRQLIEDAGFDVVGFERRNFGPAVSWAFHALLRSKSDHAGQIQQHRGVDRALDAGWRGLGKAKLLNPVTKAGNRIFPKSWYFYAKKRP